VTARNNLRLVCASANPGKVAEMATLLDGVVELAPRPTDVPDIDEDADTLEGNAMLKASVICEATESAALADDTGLEVDALNGAPGVRTARFAGVGSSDADNRRHLLTLLTGRTDRTARFRTVMTIVRPDGSTMTVAGVCEGTIATSERGTRGFGYDSVFIPAEGDGRTFAEMDATEKNAISHRAKAMTALLEALSMR
jgi:XTP/dITP diphosphohydrolase